MQMTWHMFRCPISLTKWLTRAADKMLQLFTHLSHSSLTTLWICLNFKGSEKTGRLGNSFPLSSLRIGSKWPISSGQLSSIAILNCVNWKWFFCVWQGVCWLCSLLILNALALSFSVWSDSNSTGARMTLIHSGWILFNVQPCMEQNTDSQQAGHRCEHHGHLRIKI